MEITIEKDEFTGLKKISSPTSGLRHSFEYKGQNISQDDFIELMYIEAESGRGSLIIRVHSYISKNSINKEWPHWNDSWPFIIDGERCVLSSETINTFDTTSEMKIYNLPLDVFNKFINAKEIKYSLRGKKTTVEGKFSTIHLKIFKAFEQYCFGDLENGKTILNSIEETERNSKIWTCYNCNIENTVQNNVDSFECRLCNNLNSITRPKTISNEDKIKFETKVIELVKENKVDDAIKFYATNFGYSEENASVKVKELSEKNGLKNIIISSNRKKTIIGLIFYIPIFIYLCYLGGLPERKSPIPIFLWGILILIFGVLTLRSIIRLFKK
jgi:hypothetical protein